MARTAFRGRYLYPFRQVDNFAVDRKPLPPQYSNQA